MILNNFWCDASPSSMGQSLLNYWSLLRGIKVIQMVLTHVEESASEAWISMAKGSILTEIQLVKLENSDEQGQSTQGEALAVRQNIHELAQSPILTRASTPDLLNWCMALLEVAFIRTDTLHRTMFELYLKGSETHIPTTDLVLSNISSSSAVGTLAWHLASRLRSLCDVLTNTFKGPKFGLSGLFRGRSLVKPANHLAHVPFEAVDLYLTSEEPEGPRSRSLRPQSYLSSQLYPALSVDLIWAILFQSGFAILSAASRASHSQQIAKAVVIVSTLLQHAFDHDKVNLFLSCVFALSLSLLDPNPPVEPDTSSGAPDTTQPQDPSDPLGYFKVRAMPPVRVLPNTVVSTRWAVTMLALIRAVMFHAPTAHLLVLTEGEPVAEPRHQRPQSAAAKRSTQILNDTARARRATIFARFTQLAACLHIGTSFTTYPLVPSDAPLGEHQSDNIAAADEIPDDEQLENPGGGVLVGPDVAAPSHVGITLSQHLMGLVPELGAHGAPHTVWSALQWRRVAEAVTALFFGPVLRACGLDLDSRDANHLLMLLHNPNSAADRSDEGSAVTVPLSECALPLGLPPDQSDATMQLRFPIPLSIEASIGLASAFPLSESGKAPDAAYALVRSWTLAVMEDVLLAQPLPPSSLRLIVSASTLGLASSPGFTRARQRSFEHVSKAVQEALERASRPNISELLRHVYTASAKFRACQIHAELATQLLALVCQKALTADQPVRSQDWVHLEQRLRDWVTKANTQAREAAESVANAVRNVSWPMIQYPFAGFLDEALIRVSHHWSQPRFVKSSGIMALPVTQLLLLLLNAYEALPGAAYYAKFPSTAAIVTVVASEGGAQSTSNSTGLTVPTPFILHGSIPHLMSGVQSYLASPLDPTRKLGIHVAEVFSRLVDPIQPLSLLTKTKSDKTQAGRTPEAGDPVGESLYIDGENSYSPPSYAANVEARLAPLHSFAPIYLALLKVCDAVKQIALIPPTQASVLLGKADLKRITDFAENLSKRLETLGTPKHDLQLLCRLLACSPETNVNDLVTIAHEFDCVTHGKGAQSLLEPSLLDCLQEIEDALPVSTHDEGKATKESNDPNYVRIATMHRLITVAGRRIYKSLHLTGDAPLSSSYLMYPVLPRIRVPMPFAARKILIKSVPELRDRLLLREEIYVRPEKTGSKTGDSGVKQEPKLGQENKEVPPADSILSAPHRKPLITILNDDGTEQSPEAILGSSSSTDLEQDAYTKDELKQRQAQIEAMRSERQRQRRTQKYSSITFDSDSEDVTSESEASDRETEAKLMEAKLYGAVAELTDTTPSAQFKYNTADDKKDLMKVKAPRNLREALDMLSKDDEGQFDVVLPQLPLMIRSAAPAADRADVFANLAKIVVHMSGAVALVRSQRAAEAARRAAEAGVKAAIEAGATEAAALGQIPLILTLSDYRQQAAVALAVCEPRVVVPYYCGQLYSGSRTIQDRLDIITWLVLAASELASLRSLDELESLVVFGDGRSVQLDEMSMLALMSKPTSGVGSSMVTGPGVLALSGAGIIPTQALAVRAAAMAVDQARALRGSRAKTGVPQSLDDESHDLERMKELRSLFLAKVEEARKGGKRGDVHRFLSSLPIQSLRPSDLKVLKDWQLQAKTTRINREPTQKDVRGVNYFAEIALDLFFYPFLAHYDVSYIGSSAAGEPLLTQNETPAQISLIRTVNRLSLEENYLNVPSASRLPAARPELIEATGNVNHVTLLSRDPVLYVLLFLFHSLCVLFVTMSTHQLLLHLRTLAQLLPPPLPL